MNYIDIIAVTTRVSAGVNSAPPPPKRPLPPIKMLKIVKKFLRAPPKNATAPGEITPPPSSDGLA